MLSLSSIDIALADLGNEVSVTWGEAGQPQLPIRATVDRFPYLDKDRNRAVDVSQIPRLNKGAA
jgi:vanillate/3-O-methylgallate O-demethylase